MDPDGQFCENRKEKNQTLINEKKHLEEEVP